MIRAAVLGSPIVHSLSPLLHERAYEILGLPASYQAISLDAEQAPEFLRSALVQAWSGFSLTMPLKESIFANLDLISEIDPLAQRARSVNTLLVQDGKYRAQSTDLFAFRRLLRGRTLSRVAILGGGGTARAALVAIDSSSCEIDLLLRNPSRGADLEGVALASPVSIYGLDRSLADYDVVISTVPVAAMNTVAQAVELSLNPKSLFFDVLYNPSPTPALQAAGAKGSPTLDGMDLLVEQALDQIALFAGMEFDYPAMRSALLKVGRSHLS